MTPRDLQVKNLAHLARTLHRFAIQDARAGRQESAERYRASAWWYFNSARQLADWGASA